MLELQPVEHSVGKPWQRCDQAVDVSVCIVNWNCRDVLLGCLASLHQPQGARLEIIVVDNASADGAADMVSREFPLVVLLRNATNRGFARANNQAAELASGRYLFFLNNDTVVPPDAVGRLVAFADAHPEIGMIGPRLRDGRGRVQVSYRLRPTVTTFLNRTCLVRWSGLARRAYRRYRREHVDPDATRPVEVLMGAALLLRRDLFFAYGRWDEAFAFGGEDLDLCLRVGRHRPVVYHPEIEITHYGRVSTRQRIGPASSDIAAGFARYLRKSGSPRGALWLYKLIVTVDAPVELLVRGFQYVLRRVRGKQDRARQSLLLMRGLGHFLVRGIVAFWRA
jgi:N-acetylglucosaminyl-diphospho-decaprenol L-rhamnosyltransferase